MLLKVNCHLCIFNTIRLVYYSLMICLKYHCKVPEEIDSFSTGRLPFFFGRKENVSAFRGGGGGGVLCLGHASSNHQRKWMSLWVGAKTSVGHGDNLHCGQFLWLCMILHW